MSEFDGRRPNEFDGRSMAWMHATYHRGLPVDARAMLLQIEPLGPNPDLKSGLLGTYALRRQVSLPLPEQLPAQQENAEPYEEEIDQGGSNNFYG